MLLWGISNLEPIISVAGALGFCLVEMSLWLLVATSSRPSLHFVWLYEADFRSVSVVSLQYND